MRDRSRLPPILCDLDTQSSDNSAEEMSESGGGGGGGGNPVPDSQW